MEGQRSRASRRYWRGVAIGRSRGAVCEATSGQGDVSSSQADNAALVLNNAQLAALLPLSFCAFAALRHVRSALPRSQKKLTTLRGAAIECDKGTRYVRHLIPGSSDKHTRPSSGMELFGPKLSLPLRRDERTSCPGFASFWRFSSWDCLTSLSCLSLPRR